MDPSNLDAVGSLALLAPFLMIFVVTVYCFLRRALLKRRHRARIPHSGTYSSSLALGMAFQILQVFYQPNIVHEIQAKLVERVEEDDEGDPETPEKHLHRQFRRIRRGEPIDMLVLRL